MNTYLYRIKGGYVMIDTGYQNSYAKCTSAMERKGISWDDVKCIFLTHAHDDHAGFLKEALDKHQHIKCIVNGKSFPVLAKGQNSFEGGCSGKVALFFCHIFPATIFPGICIQSDFHTENIIYKISYIFF